MIDRVAAAIKAEIGRQLLAQPLHDSKTDWHASIEDWSPNGGSLDLRKIARVAIETMQEPTKEMKESVGNDADQIETYRWMAGAALKE
jgi:hypothetical protein